MFIQNILKIHPIPSPT